MKTAVFVKYYTIASSPSILNYLGYLAEFSLVDLYCHGAGSVDSLSSLSPNINIINFDRYGKPIEYFRTLFRKADYNLYTAFDPQGLIFCKKLFPKAIPFYYSLELFLKDDHSGMYYPEEIMQSERMQIKSCSGVIIQSEEKEKLFRKDYDLPDSIPSFILPVTYCGKSISAKSDYIRENYNIPVEKKILLHLGGINPYFSSKEICEVIGEMKDWVIFFQGNGDEAYIEEIKTTCNNAIFSKEFFKTPDGLDLILQSADAGLAWYNDISAGFRTAGRSSGKISAYLRYGLPIVTKSYASTIGAVEDTGCGKCIENYNDLPSALNYIDENYSSLSDNCRKEYDKTYNFEDYKIALKKFLKI